MFLAERRSCENPNRSRENGWQHEGTSPHFDVGQGAGNVRHRDHAASDQRRLDHRDKGGCRRLQSG